MQKERGLKEENADILLNIGRMMEGKICLR
jgi:hypothetical protein